MRDRLWLAGGAAALAVAVGGYLAHVATSPPLTVLSLFDLHVYVTAGQVAVHAPAHLYQWQFQPGYEFTYPPAAAAVFAAAGYLPWTALSYLWTAMSVLALGMTCWIALGRIGHEGHRRVAVALFVIAVAFWTEPMQRAIHLGQIDVLLMALVVWDLSRPDNRRWKGAGIGLAAGLKLVPLIFLLYLALARRRRQAAVGLGTFAGTVLAGWAVLPGASAQWWLHGVFLRAGRTGFVASVANQSLLGLLTRLTGSLGAGTRWWLAVAVIVGIGGLAVAVRCDRAGLPVHGWVACALTGLLISPVSWDHHWVWFAPALAVLVAAAADTVDGSRWIRWLAAAALAVLLAAWPVGGQTRPWGLIWTVPFTPGQVDHPWNSEYHWHFPAMLAGNLYLLIGLVSLAVLAAVSSRASAKAQEIP